MNSIVSGRITVDAREKDYLNNNAERTKISQTKKCEFLQFALYLSDHFQNVIYLFQSRLFAESDQFVALAYFVGTDVGDLGFDYDVGTLVLIF
jgi:hypothetical protein